MTHEIVLSGCAPVPLAYYLKALGILRLVAEQADEAAAGRWDGESFVLRSALDRESLQHFFLEAYRPTPIVAPWNGGSGFYYQEGKLKEKDPITGKRLKTGIRNQPTEATKAVDRLIGSSGDRFTAYRETLRLTKEAIARLGFQEAPKEEQKKNFIQRLRNTLPDWVLPSIDAAVVLSVAKANFAPLLGTGWNDGNLDFSNNFIQRVCELFLLDSGAPTSTAQLLCAAALYGDVVPGLQSDAVGQFNPGGAGGPNAGTGFEADSLVNPWDFVLMLEGALLFAAATTRRLESAESGALSYPFTVRTTGAGSGAVSLKDEAPARAEIWFPLWDRFADIAEIKALFAEGRATLGRRPVKDGLDFARAIAALGVNRGIRAFQRYGFLMRSGKAYLATPLNRIPVRRNPEVDLIADLDQSGFLDRLRRFARDSNAPGRIQSLTRRLEDALFDLANMPNRFRLQMVIMSLGELESVLAESRKAREAAIPPVPPLSEAWILKADDGSAEFRIALSLASMTVAGTPMRMLVSPVKQGKAGWGWEWDERVSAAWGRRSLVENVGDLLEQQLHKWMRAEATPELLGHQTQASSSHIQAFLLGATDDTRILRLVAGLSLCRQPKQLLTASESDGALPATYAVLKAFFVSTAELRSLSRDRDADLVLPTEIVRLLRADKVDKALQIGWRRLRIAGVMRTPTPGRPPRGTFLDGKRLLAALVIPLDDSALKETFRRLAQPVFATNETKGEVA